MGAAVGKQFQTNPVEQKARRSSIVINALQQYHKEFPRQPMGVENGVLDAVIFRRAITLALESSRVDSSLKDITEEDIHEIGLLYFSSIPKVEHVRNTTNHSELLIEDIVETDSREGQYRENDSSTGRESQKQSDEVKQLLRANSSKDASNLDSGYIPVLPSPQQRRISPTSKAPTSRVKSILLESASSILPNLFTPSAIETDYSSCVAHRVSVKNKFSLEEPSREDFLLSGAKFLSPDEKRNKNKSREALRKQGENIPLQDSDRNSSIPAPEKWKQRILSSGLSPTTPANYRMSSNLPIGEKKSASNEQESMPASHNSYAGESLRNIAPSNDVAVMDEPVQRRKQSAVLIGDESDNDSTHNDSTHSRSGSDDDVRRNGRYSQHVQDAPQLTDLNLNNVQNNVPQKCSMSLTAARRKKSLIPLVDRVCIKYKDGLKRAESLDRNNLGRRLEGSREGERESRELDNHKGEEMRGLHLQKILSSAQNAQLQKEVDALQKQLAQLEDLEGEMDMSSRQTKMAVASANHVTSLSAHPHTTTNGNTNTATSSHPNSQLHKRNSSARRTDSAHSGLSARTPRTMVQRMVSNPILEISAGDHITASSSRGGKRDLRGLNGVNGNGNGAEMPRERRRDSSIERKCSASKERQDRKDRVKSREGEKEKERHRERSLERSTVKMKGMREEAACDSAKDSNKDRDSEKSRDKDVPSEKTKDRYSEMLRKGENANVHAREDRVNDKSPRDSGKSKEEGRDRDRVKERDRDREGSLERDEGSTPSPRSGPTGVRTRPPAPGVKRRSTRSDAIEDGDGAVFSARKEKERDRDRDKIIIPSRVKRVSVATSSFLNPPLGIAPTSPSAISFLPSAAPSPSPPIDDVKHQARSPRGSKKTTGRTGGGVAESRRTVGMVSPLLSPSFEAVSAGAIAVRKASIVGYTGRDRDRAKEGEKDRERERDKGYCTPSEKVHASPEQFSPTGVRSPRQRSKDTDECTDNPSAVFPYSESAHTPIDLNGNRATHNGYNLKLKKEVKKEVRQDVKLHFNESTENSDAEYDLCSMRRGDGMTNNKERDRDRERDRDGDEDRDKEKERESHRALRRRDGEGAEIMLNRNKVDARKLYEKRVSREERSKVHRNLPTASAPSNGINVGIGMSVSAAEDSEGESKLLTDRGGRSNGHGNGVRSERGKIMERIRSNSHSMPGEGTYTYHPNLSTHIDNRTNTKTANININENSSSGNGHSFRPSRKSTAATDDGHYSEASLSEQSDNGGEEDKGYVSRAKKALSQGVSRGRIVGRRRPPNLIEILENDNAEKQRGRVEGKESERENERDRERYRDREREGEGQIGTDIDEEKERCRQRQLDLKQAYQCSVFSAERKRGMSNGCINANIANSEERLEYDDRPIHVNINKNNNNSSSSSSGARKDSRGDRGDENRHTNAPCLSYVSGEESAVETNYTAPEDFSFSNPLKQGNGKHRDKEKDEGRERDGDRDRDRDKERERDSNSKDSRLSCRVRGKAKKSKRRMSFPRQPSSESADVENKVPVLGLIQEPKRDLVLLPVPSRLGGAGFASHLSPRRQGSTAWTDDLDSRWGEVDFLLRKRIVSEEDIEYTTTAAEAGMLFIDQLNSLAKSLNILRGTLSRWLLPYDNNTRIDEQCSTPHSVVDNMPEIVRGRISERQVHYLVAGANGVRRLVRIKIADDNDLEQARVALQTTINFFKKLQVEATKNNLTNFQLFGCRT